MIRRFNRFELKYILSIQQAEAIMQDLAAQTLPDAHSGPDGYRISSLYYDSPELDFFWDKIEGVKFRRKIRVRIYPQVDKAPETAMVEIKQRINKTVQKRRLILPLDQAYRLCEESIDLPGLDAIDETVASEIRYLVQAKHLVPSCIIEYNRKAFVGTAYNPGLRITFDTHLKCRIKDLRLEHDSLNRYFLPPDWVIMEVKVDETVPDWVSSLLISHNCELNRVSKYCAGLAFSKNIQVTHLAISPHANDIAHDRLSHEPAAKTQNLAEVFPKTTRELPPLPRHLPHLPEQFYGT